MGKTGKKEGTGRAGNGRKKRKREGGWQRGCKPGKAGIEGRGKKMRQREMEKGKEKRRKEGRF